MLDLLVCQSLRASAGADGHRYSPGGQTQLETKGWPLTFTQRRENLADTTSECALLGARTLRGG